MLSGADTQEDTHTYIYRCKNQSNLEKPGTHQPAAGSSLVYKQFQIPKFGPVYNFKNL